MEVEMGIIHYLKENPDKNKYRPIIRKMKKNLEYIGKTALNIGWDGGRGE